MKTYLGIIIIGFGKCFSQSPTIEKKYFLKSFGDTYVVKLFLEEEKLITKCNCLISSDKECILFKGNIQNIYLLSDNEDLFNAGALSQVRYFMTDLKNLKLNHSYIATLAPATDKRYLRINSIIDINADSAAYYSFLRTGPYLSGLVECFRIGFFNKLFIKMGLVKRENIKYDKKRKYKDDFLEFIINSID